MLSLPPRRCPIRVPKSFGFNPLHAELNPICHFLALLGAHPILHVSRIRVKMGWLGLQQTCYPAYEHNLYLRVCVCVCVCTLVFPKCTDKTIPVLISQRTHGDVTVNFQAFSTCLLYVGTRNSLIMCIQEEVKLAYSPRKFIYFISNGH